MRVIDGSWVADYESDFYADGEEEYNQDSDDERFSKFYKLANSTLPDFNMYGGKLKCIQNDRLNLFGNYDQP